MGPKIKAFSSKILVKAFSFKAEAKSPKIKAYSSKILVKAFSFKAEAKSKRFAESGRA